MTVIAWDGSVLAADKMAVDGGGIRRTTTKIQRHHDALLAMTGSWDIACELREWWKMGASQSNFPEKARGDVATLIVIRTGVIETYNSGPFPLIHEVKQCAFGSGRDFAEAAMYCGKSAIEAVEIACKFQSDCGNGVDYMALDLMSVVGA